jgi:hypothetical protein
MDRPIPDSTWCYNASTPAELQMARQHRTKSIDRVDGEVIRPSALEQWRELRQLPTISTIVIPSPFSRFGLSPSSTHSRLTTTAFSTQQQSWLRQRPEINLLRSPFRIIPQTNNKMSAFRAGLSLCSRRVTASSGRVLSRPTNGATSAKRCYSDLPFYAYTTTVGLGGVPLCVS